MTAYTLYGQEATGSSLASDTDPYTSGVQFSVSEACTLTAIWYYSPSGAAVLPGTIALYEVSGTVLVASQAASWSGAAGSGWVRAPFTSPPALTASTAYKGCVFYAGGSEWYGLSDPSYYTTGAGAAGIMNGPLTAPNNAGASPGQCSYATGGSLAYPDESDAGANNWVDIEVTASGTAHTATAALTVTPSFSAARTRGKYRTGALTVTPVVHRGARQRGKYRTGSLPSRRRSPRPGPAATTARAPWGTPSSRRSGSAGLPQRASLSPPRSAPSPSRRRVRAPRLHLPRILDCGVGEADTRVTVSPAGAQTVTITSAARGEPAATLYPPGPQSSTRPRREAPPWPSRRRPCSRPTQWWRSSRG